LNLVRFDKSHYPVLSEWWTKHGHANVAFESLSPVGLVCMQNESPLCMSFLYLASGCDLAWICFTTGNPEIEKSLRHEAVDYCLNGLFELSRKYGRNHVVCYSQSKGVTSVFEDHGFIVGLPHDMLYGQVGS
jgi:hypothetical protein